MKILEKLKSMSLVALAAIFLLSATLISCGDNKKEATSEDESTEAVIEDTDEHPSDSTHQEGEHPSEEGGEHPTD